MFDEIVSPKNIVRAWNEFKHGKIQKQDIAEFSVQLEDHIFRLSRELKAGTYAHSEYKEFYIYDPKRRHIHKAAARDRLLHHAIFRVIEPMYDKKFIFDSYSSRKNKGMHKAHERFHDFAWKLSRNDTRTVWVLKCDIRKFFDCVDHQVLLKILGNTVADERALDLLRRIISSFETRPGKGIPLGNLTSQLFSNVYLDQFDQYVKRVLRIKHYIRYADDFVVLDTDKERLTGTLAKLQEFLTEKLMLTIHPDKIHIRKFTQGVDFLGYVIFPHHRILRTKTKQRIFKKAAVLRANLSRETIRQEFFEQSMASYYGLLKHCRGRGVRKIIGEINTK